MKEEGKEERDRFIDDVKRGGYKIIEEIAWDDKIAIENQNNICNTVLPSISECIMSD